MLNLGMSLCKTTGNKQLTLLPLSSRQSIRGQQTSVLASLTQFLIMHTLQKQAFDSMHNKKHPAIFAGCLLQIALLW